MRAVRFDAYGGVDVLEVREVEDPVAGPGQVLVAVRAAGINPGEIAIREGASSRAVAGDFPLRGGQRLCRDGASCGRGRHRIRARRRSAGLDRRARQPR